MIVRQTELKVMPSSCYDCKVGVCHIQSSMTADEYDTIRHKDCPLREMQTREEARQIIEINIDEIPIDEVLDKLGHKEVGK